MQVFRENGNNKAQGKIKKIYENYTQLYTPYQKMNQFYKIKIIVKTSLSH